MSDASISPQPPAPGEYFVWQNDTTGALLIQLSKTDIGLTDQRIALGGRVFEAKPEAHITVYGRAIGRQVQAAIAKDPALEDQLEQAIATTDWSFTLEDRFYHVSEDKRVINPDGAVEIVHQESVVQMVQVPNIGSFFARLGRIVGAPLEVPPTHITLYTLGNPLGIGLANQAEFETLVKGEISRTDLKPIRSEYKGATTCHIPD